MTADIYIYINDKDHRLISSSHRRNAALAPLQIFCETRPSASKQKARAAKPVRRGPVKRSGAARGPAHGAQTRGFRRAMG